MSETEKTLSAKVQEDGRREGVYAKRVGVPIANPATAPQLIRFAASLVHPERGKVRAIYVHVPDTPYKEARAQLQNVCDLAANQGIPVEMVVVNASNPARGILDGLREQNVDLLVLGFQTPKDGQFVFGDVTEEVARVVPTDLIVYRSIPQQNIKRVIVPVTDIDGTQNALLHGAHIAEFHKGKVVATYVETSSPTPFWKENTPLPIWQQMSLLEMAIYDEPYRDLVGQMMLKGIDMTSSVVAATTDDDLILLDVSQDYDKSEKWLFGPRAQKMLRLSPGAVALIRRASKEDETFVQRTMRNISRWTPTLTLGERSAVIDQAGELSRLNTNFVVMISLSCVLASIGLLQNSAAVIIGAMLVAPLMSPLMGFGVAFSMGELRMMVRAAQTVLAGVGLVLGISLITGIASSFNTPTIEMLSRGEPTFLDMIVALASGGAGAFAMARRDIPAALAGVAIAAALVPPICTTGLALALGNMDLFFGAGLLSFVNIVCISIAASGTFASLGIRDQDKDNSRARLGVAVMVLIILGIPLAYLLQQNLERSNLRYQTERIIEAEFERVEVTEIEIDGEEVFVTVRSPQELDLLDMALVQSKIEDEVNSDIELHLIVLDVVQVNPR